MEREDVAPDKIRRLLDDDVSSLEPRRSKIETEPVGPSVAPVETRLVGGKEESAVPP